MEEVIAHCWQVAVADMWFLWRKCVLVAVNRNQVVNKFIWRDYTQEILQFYNIIQIPKNFILLTIHMMWICILKMLNTKNTVRYSLVEQRMPIHLQLILCHQQGNSAVFCQFKKKKKKDYKHSYQTNSKILWTSTRKRSSAPFKFKMFLLFFNFNQTNFFCHEGEADTHRLIG